MKIYMVTPVEMQNNEAKKILWATSEYFQNETDAKIAQSTFRAWGLGAVIKTIEVK